MLEAKIDTEMWGYGYIAVSIHGWEPGEPIGHGWNRLDALDDLIEKSREG